MANVRFSARTILGCALITAVAACSVEIRLNRPGAASSNPAAAGHASPAVAAAPARATKAGAPGGAPDASRAAAGVDSAALDAYLDPKNAKYGPLMDFNARATALRAMTKGISAALAAKTSAAREANVLAVLKARPELEASGVAPGLSAWGRFKDGRLLIVPTYTIARAQAGLGKAAPHASDERGESGPGSVRAKELPKSKTAVAIDAMRYDPAFTASVMKSAKDAGYVPRVLTNADTSVKGLKTAFNGEGFFYMHMHGGVGYERDDVHAPPVFDLQSTTVVKDCYGKTITIFKDEPFDEQYGTIEVADAAKCSDHEYEEELKAGRLVYGFAEGVFKTVPGKAADVQEDGWYYAITPKFIDHYAKFGERSWMYLNVCQSAMPVAKVMFAVMKKKNLVGAAGWTESVDPTTGMRAAELFMKRMLGNPALQANTGKDTPPGRPWDAQSVLDELVRKHWNHTVVDDKPADLILLGDNALLRPSLSHMDVDEKKRELTLHGAFGTAAGKVSIGGKDCPVNQGAWAADTIVCALSDDTLGGDVVVEVDGRKSNPAPLTAWALHLQYTLDWPQGVPGGLKGSFTFDINFRGDVHGHREAPDQAPKDAAPFYMLPAPGSTCTPRSEGQVTASTARFGAAASSEAIEIKNEPPSGDTFCRAYALIDPAARTMKLALLASKKSGSFTNDHGGSPGMGLLPTPKIFTETLPPPPGAPFPPQRAVLLGLDANYAPNADVMLDNLPVGPGKVVKIALKVVGGATSSYPTVDTQR